MILLKILKPFAVKRGSDSQEDSPSHPHGKNLLFFKAFLVNMIVEMGNLPKVSRGENRKIF